MTSAIFTNRWLNTLQNRAIALLPVALLLTAWWYISNSGLYPQQLLVPPQQVYAALQELVDTGELQEHLRMSLHRLAFGMLIGCTAGLVFGVAMGLSRTFEAFTAPLFNVIRQVPSIALIPILILIFGIGETFKVLIVTKAAFFPVGLAAFTAVQGLPKN